MLNAENGAQFAIRPTGARDLYAIADYVEPLEGNQTLPGFDQLSDPVRRQAVEVVRDSGALTASGRITLVQDAVRGNPMPAFQLRLPIYRNGAPRDTIEQRRAAFVGLVGSAFRVPD